MDGIYENIYVIGHGAPPLACMKLLQERGIPAIFFDTGGPLDVFTHKAAKGSGIALERISKKDLPALFDERQRTLVLSANNTIIFPAKIVGLENLRILNYHNSLLPAHRGMHAEAWTIYAGDPLAGISWHVVDGGIDTGPLVVQKAMPVGELTSLGLLRRQCDMAIAALAEALPAILCGAPRLTPQPPGRLPPHRSADRPNGGILDLSWPAKKIWNFLRAYDYGALKTLGTPRCSLCGAWHTWDGYARLAAADAGPSDWPIRSTGVVLKNVSQFRAEDAGGQDAKGSFY